MWDHKSKTESATLYNKTQQAVTVILGLLVLSTSACAPKKDEAHLLPSIVSKFEGINALSPSWSPDGKKLAFIQRFSTGESTQTGHLALLEVSTGNVVQLSEEEWSYDSQPTWAPDGTQLAIERYYEIWLVDTKNGNSKFLTAGAGATWSPHGDMLAVFRGPKSGGPSDGYEIVFVTLRGEELRTIPAGNLLSRQPASLPTSTRRNIPSETSPALFYPGGYLSGTDWSSDGQKLVYSVIFLNKGYGDVLTINTDGSGFQALTSTGYNEQPAWSPDATKLAYISSADGFVTNLVITSSSGGCHLRLTEGGYIQSPSWSPDGRQIAVLDSASGTIYILDVEKFMTDQYFDPKQCNQ